MKQRLCLLVVLSVTASATYAQSSVTLYGVLDTGFLYTNNQGGQHAYQAANGNLQGNRWGLRGKEDLGGGWAAIFTLENGFGINDGTLKQGGRQFGRQAFVGLSSPYGAVTMGRQYDSLVDYVEPLSGAYQWAGVYAAHAGDLDDLNNSYRFNNAIKYTSLDYRGFKFGAVYSLGGTAGSYSTNTGLSAGADYSNGPLSLGVAYLNLHNPNTAYYDGSAANGAAAAVSGTKSPVYSGFTSARTLQVISAGGNYRIGNVSVGLIYSNAQFQGIGTTTSGPNPADFRGTASFNTVELNARYAVLPALWLSAVYDYTRGSSVNRVNGSTDPGASYQQIGLGADYQLSKRTDLYLVGLYQKAAGTDSTGHAAVAALSNITASNNNRQLAVETGIRHRF